MVFCTTSFLFFFFPIVLGVYYLLGKKGRNIWLLIASLIFFAWSQPNYLWILLLNIVVNYVSALLIDRYRDKSRITLTLCVIVNIAILFYFKYFLVVIDSINSIFGTNYTWTDIILPIGISFFTFQGLSYVIDVYRYEVEPQRKLLDLALYISLFPQLIAGPIVRYKTIDSEISNRKYSFQDFSQGLERFIIGLSKKVILANTMAKTADSIWANGADQNTIIIAWLGSIAYSFQIFFDFSGYSDMAIGLGLIFGFHFEENFNLPYISKSITEFWRRWHISLSTWFRDYVYIPLGGNRKHVYLNLAIIFLLTGIWHGAPRHFWIWGVWNGFFIILERLIRNRRKNKLLPVTSDDRILLKGVVSAFQHIYTLLIINFGWVLFRADGTSDAIYFWKSMFGMNNNLQPRFTVMWYLDGWTLFIFLMCIVFSSTIPTKCVYYLKNNINEKCLCVLKYILLLTLMLLAVIKIVSGTYNPFIYFQF